MVSCKSNAIRYFALLLMAAQLVAVIDLIAAAAAVATNQIQKQSQYNGGQLSKPHHHDHQEPLAGELLLTRAIFVSEKPQQEQPGRGEGTIKSQVEFKPSFLLAASSAAGQQQQQGVDGGRDQPLQVSQQQQLLQQQVDEPQQQLNLGLAWLTQFDDAGPNNGEPSSGAPTSVIDSSSPSSSSSKVQPVSGAATTTTTSTRMTASQDQGVYNETYINRAGYSASQQQVGGAAAELGGDFLNFFDELWRIKNNSINVLLQLEYFNLIDGKPVTNRTQLRPTATIPTSASPPRRPDPYRAPPTFVGGGNYNPRLTASNINRNSTTGNNYGHSYHPKQPMLLQGSLNMGSAIKNSLVGQRAPLAGVGIQLNHWLAQLNKKINRVLVGLTKPLMGSGKLAPASASGQHNQITTVNSPADDDERQFESTRFLAAARLEPAAKQGGQRSPTEGPASASSLVESQVTGQAQRAKRQALDEPGAMMSGPEEAMSTSAQSSRLHGSGNRCSELDQSQKDQCRSRELVVKNNLSSSFPGTLAGIEDNCRHVTFLLRNCWPQQLQYIRTSLASWNESLMSLTEFPLVTGGGGGGQRFNTDTPMVSCGVTPQMPGYLLDRISWMWLNLCMDRKFRQDYVDNLKCLGMWTQERAQQVCNSEYRRLQASLADSEGGLALTRTGGQRGAGSVGSSTGPGGAVSEKVRLFGLETQTPVPANSDPMSNIYTGNVNDDSSKALDRELESKTLCCMFDLFLRCVNRQALRDCGRGGAQFVVNFMSRVGTDDIKYICNGEAKAMQKVHESGGDSAGRRNALGPTSGERGPFIESNYCTDLRIYSSLYAPIGDRNRGGAGSGGGSRPTHGRDGNRNPTNINYDPTYFGSETLHDFNASRSRLDTVSPLVYLVAWASALISLLVNTVSSSGIALI